MTTTQPTTKGEAMNNELELARNRENEKRLMVGLPPRLANGDVDRTHSLAARTDATTDWTQSDSEIAATYGVESRHVRAWRQRVDVERSEMEQRGWRWCDSTKEYIQQ